jgi:hypothetical protein
MSDERSKEKHSKRLHQEESAIAKQVKIAKAHGVPVKEPHKLHKHHALDCGNPKCIMCASPRKIFKEVTIQEKKFMQTENWNE